MASDGRTDWIDSDFSFQMLETGLDHLPQLLGILLTLGVSDEAGIAVLKSILRKLLHLLFESCDGLPLATKLFLHLEGSVLHEFDQRTDIENRTDRTGGLRYTAAHDEELKVRRKYQVLYLMLLRLCVVTKCVDVHPLIP